MEDSRLVAASAIALAVTLFAIFAMRPWARRVGLVDKPDLRKRHKGRVPVIGGICFFLGTLAGLSYLGYLDSFVMSVMMASALIVAAGVADDVCNLSVRARIGGEAAVIGLVILGSGVYLNELGPVLPGIELSLGLVGIPLTVFAVIGLINAFNMLDGIDGLATAMAMVSIATILVFAGAGGAMPGVMVLLVVLFASLVPYLCVNLGWPDGRRVFMGDAGSTLLGFLIAWSLIYLSQAPVGLLGPVDVLWCVALPVIDTFAVMVRRMRAGRSPFSADRQHLHHLLIDAGSSPKGALVMMVAAGVALGALGYVLRDTPVLFNLFAFVATLLAYVFGLTRLLDRARRRLAGRTREKPETASPAIPSQGPDADVATHSMLRGLPALRSFGDPDAPHDMPVKALCVLASAPDAVGMAPIAQQLDRDERFHATVCVAEPEHETERMLGLFDLAPDVRLHAVASDENPAEVTTATLSSMMRVLAEVQPDVMLVTGSESMTMAASLAAYYSKVPLVCIDHEPTGHAGSDEAGEGGRKVVHALASMHVATSAAAGRRLLTEGVPGDRVMVSGDVGLGTLRTVLQHLREDPALGAELAAGFPYLRDNNPLLVAASMQGRVEDRRHLATALEMVARRRPDVDIIWPAPTRCELPPSDAEKSLSAFANVHVVEAPDYLSWVHLLDRAYLVLTDSAVLAESHLLGKPVIFIHDETAEDGRVDASLRGAGATAVATAGRILTLLTETAAYQALCLSRTPGDAPTAADCGAVLQALASLAANPTPQRDAAPAVDAEDHAGVDEGELYPLQRVREAS
jgi:undecaprenyl-phosphate alpha-N-acetylglucosaminyl 1-phosphatetransferase/UDP-N-acetylglucosamine 2-epimerase